MNRAVLGIDDIASAATEAQRRVLGEIADGPRGSVAAPFLAMIDAPELTEAVQKVGAVLRFGSALPGPIRECAILATAGAVGSRYEWDYHAPIAIAEGVPPDVIEATLPGANCDGLQDPWGFVISLCRHLALDRAAPDALFGLAVMRLGRRETVELVGIATYYPLLATFLRCAGKDLSF